MYNDNFFLCLSVTCMLACVLYIHMHACICIDHCPCWVYTVELHDDAQKAIAIDVYSASCMNKNPDNWFENSCIYTLHIKSIRLYNHSMQYIPAYLAIYMYSIADYSMPEYSLLF